MSELLISWIAEIIIFIFLVALVVAISAGKCDR